MSVADSAAQQIHTLYSDHHGWLYGWLRLRLGNAADAADLAQDTFLRLLKSGNLPPTEESRRFLTRVAKGLMIDRFRRQAIEAAYLESLSRMPEAFAPGPETQHAIIETLLEIDALLDALPDKVRQALLLRQLDGLSYAAIATRLSVSVSSVEKYVARGLAACCTALEQA